MMTPLPPTLTLNTSGSSPSSNRTRTPSTLSSSDQNHGSSGVEFQSMMDSISDIENETSVYVSDGAFIEQLLLSQQHKGLGRASPLNYQRQKRKTSTPKSSSSSTTTSGNHDKKSKGLTSTSSFKDKVFSTIKKGLEQVNAVATTGNTSNNNSNSSNSSNSGSNSNSNSGSSSTTSSSGKNSSDHHSSSSTMNNDNQVSISINDTYQLMVVFDFHLFATGDESIEIHFAMYSLNEARFISESIVISSDSGKNRISLFRDITGSNLLKDELYLVGRAFRKYELGHQNSNSSGSSSTNSSKNLSIHSSNNNNNNNNTDDLDIDTLRRPLAVCAIPFDTESIKELANGHSVTKYCEFYEKTHEKKFTMLHAVIAAQHSGRKLNAKPTYLLEQDDHHAPSCSSNTSSTTTTTNTTNMSSSNSSLLSASNNLENSNDIIDFATLLSGNQKDTSLASLSRKGSMVGTHSPNSMTSLSSTALDSSSGSSSSIGSNSSGSGSNLLSSHSSNHSLVSAASSHDSTLVQSAPTSLYTYTSIGSECKALKDQLNVNLVFYKGDYDVIMKEVPQFQRLFTAKPINWFSINTKNEAKTNYSFLENRCDIYPCLDRATLSSSILKSKNPLIVMRLFEVKNPQTKEGKFIPIYRTNAGGSSMNHSTTKRSNSGLIHTAGGSSHHLLTPIQSSSNFGSSSNLTASPGENGSSSSSPNSYPLGSSFTQQQQDNNNNNMHMNGPFYYSSYVFCKKTNPKYFEPFHIDASHVENFDHLYLYLYVYNVNTTNKSKYELEEQPVLIGYYKFTDQDSLMNFEKMKLIELYKTKSLSHTSSSTSNSNTTTTTTTSGNSNTTTSTSTTTGNTNHSDHHPYSSDSMKTLNRTNTIVTSRTNVLAVLPDLKMSKPEKNNIKMSIIFFISSIPHSHLLQILFLWKQFILKNVSMMELLEQVKKKITYKECVLHAHNLFKSLFSILEFYDEHEEIRNKTLETLFYFIGQYFSKTEQLFEQIVSKIPISEKVYQSILKHLNDRFQESITSLESILKEFNSRSSTEMRSSVGNSTIPDTHYKSLYHAIQSFSLVMILLKKRHFSQEKKKITSSYQKEKQLKEIQEFKEQFHSLVAKLLAIFNLDGKNVPNIAIIKGNLMKSLTVSVFDILHDMLPQSHFSNFLKSFFESTMSITLTEKFNVYSNILKCKCFIHSSGSSSSVGSSGNSSTLNQQQFDHFDGSGSNSSNGGIGNNESMSRTGSSGGILSLSVIHSSAISHVLQQNTRYEIVDVIILKILFPMIRESLKSCLDGTMNQNNTTTTTTTNMNNTTTSISSSNNTQQTLKHYLTLLTQIGRLFEMTLLNLLSENNEEVSIPTQLIMLFEQLCQFGPTLYQLDMSLANESKKYLKEMSNVNSDSSSKSKISLDQLYTNNMELRKKIYSLYYVIIYWCSTLQNFELFNQTMNYLKKNSKDSTSVFTSILLNMINCTLNGGEFGDKSCYPCVNPLVSEIEMFRPFHKKRVKDIFGFLQYLQKQEKEASKNVFVDGNLLIESLCLASFSSILESETRITIFRNMTEYYSTREQVSKFNNTPITPLNVQKFIETLFLIFSSNTSLKQNNNSIITTPTPQRQQRIHYLWNGVNLCVENSSLRIHFQSGQTSHQADIQLVIKIFNQLELKRKNQKLGEAQSPQKKAKKNVLADRYEILKKIGKGGFGSVFKVCDLNSEDKKILAMKILPKEEGNNAEFIQMSKLNHKHILPVYEIFETKLGNYDKWCFTMPFLELGDFQSYLLNLKSNLPIKRILNFMDQMLSCIEYIHGREVYHRDIKPENFLLRTEDEVVLSDFGLSKGDVETVVTKTSIVGTELFQSPELFAGDVKDVSKTDIYGLGCVFYIMITRDFQTTVRISIMSNGGKEIREKLTQTLCGNNNHENNKTTNSNNGNTSSNNNSSNNTSSNNNSSSGSGSSGSGSNTTRQDHASLNIQALIDFVMIMLDKDYEKRPSASVARQVWLEQKIGYKTTTIGQ
ncbi:hypothetical protein C9374_011879 [Naegleria lovaniensis]|uniref:Protein kinase domain-containing protein n=1 Tax=Naegleria lovaniensis TaxID=51637 RepID=A0AA88KCF3_NAELO|nr:uncharacterized protein C9374_011879 [Naegleria lovaniensis]KAG2373790.1 hypothetical protein C9374_011879 [Naegleria lovaniensis]